MIFRIQCSNGVLNYRTQDSDLFESLGKVFLKTVGPPINGVIPIFYIYSGTVNEARELLGLPISEPEFNPAPDPVKLTDRQLLKQIRRTVRRIEKSTFNTHAMLYDLVAILVKKD